MSRSFRWTASEPPSSEDLDAYPGNEAPTPTTPSTAKSRITEVLGGDPLGPACPQVWRRWVDGVFTPLQAPRSVTVRPRQEQLPVSTTGREILQLIRLHFGDAPHRFEGFAADLWLMSDDRVASVDVTRPTRDGGRDATGEYLIGPKSDPITLDFALEAKCYAATNGVGVREVSRLISRLRARQFGILVTTSYLADQAYREIREDGHPVVVISGSDIVDILSRVGFRTTSEVNAYLQSYHPAPTTVDVAFPTNDLTVPQTVDFTIAGGVGDEPTLTAVLADPFGSAPRWPGPPAVTSG